MSHLNHFSPDLPLRAVPDKIPHLLIKRIFIKFPLIIIILSPSLAHLISSQPPPPPSSLTFICIPIAAIHRTYPISNQWHSAWLSIYRSLLGDPHSDRHTASKKKTFKKMLFSRYIIYGPCQFDLGCIISAYFSPVHGPSVTSSIAPGRCRWCRSGGMVGWLELSSPCPPWPIKLK